MDERDLPPVTHDPKLHDLFMSAEYEIFKHLQRIQQAYFNLINCQINGANYSEAQTFLKEMQLAAGDMRKHVLFELNSKGIHPSQIRDVRSKTQHDTLDDRFNNTVHYYQRFLGCEPQHKLMNLSALHGLVEDLEAIAIETPISRYYKELDFLR